MELVKNNFYHMVISDHKMPNIDGIKATEIIRHMTDKKKSMIPIVAMTANAFAEDREKSLAVGMNAHIAKPIDVPELLKTISDLLK